MPSTYLVLWKSIYCFRRSNERTRRYSDSIVMPWIHRDLNSLKCDDMKFGREAPFRRMICLFHWLVLRIIPVPLTGISPLQFILLPWKRMKKAIPKWLWLSIRICGVTSHKTNLQNRSVVCRKKRRLKKVIFFSWHLQAHLAVRTTDCNGHLNV
jgi:hypothetical protein